MAHPPEPRHTTRPTVRTRTFLPRARLEQGLQLRPVTQPCSCCGAGEPRCLTTTSPHCTDECRSTALLSGTRLKQRRRPVPGQQSTVTALLQLCSPQEPAQASQAELDPAQQQHFPAGSAAEPLTKWPAAAQQRTVARPNPQPLGMASPATGQALAALALPPRRSSLTAAGAAGSRP